MDKVNFKYLKTFESFEVINEEELLGGLKGKVKKWATGEGSPEEMKERKDAFVEEMENLKAEIKKNPKAYAESAQKLNFDELLKKAEDNKFLGELRATKSAKDGLIHVFYNEGSTGLQKVGGAAAGQVSINR